MEQWGVGKCLTTGFQEEKKKKKNPWLVAFAILCDVKTPTVTNFKLLNWVSLDPDLGRGMPCWLSSASTMWHQQSYYCKGISGAEATQKLLLPGALLDTYIWTLKHCKYKKVSSIRIYRPLFLFLFFSFQMKNNLKCTDHMKDSVIHSLLDMSDIKHDEAQVSDCLKCGDA